MDILTQGSVQRGLGGLASAGVVVVCLCLLLFFFYFCWSGGGQQGTPGAPARSIPDTFFGHPVFPCPPRGKAQVVGPGSRAGKIIFPGGTGELSPSLKDSGVSRPLVCTLCQLACRARHLTHGLIADVLSLMGKGTARQLGQLC